jgi:ferredoxin
MTDICFIAVNGSDRITVKANPGDNLLVVAQNCGQPLEGTCEGHMACSTCHVILTDEDFAKLPPATEAEEDMLDFAAGVTRTSRLACQIAIDGAWDQLTVRIPPVVRNMQGR